MSRGTPAAVLVAVVAALLSACSPNASPTLEHSEAWAQQVRAIADDSSRPYADETREVLRAAADEGEMTFELYERGVLAFYGCIEAAGLTPVIGQPAPSSEGLPVHTISYQFPVGIDVGDPRLDELDALATTCEQQYLTIIEVTYVTQPVALANLDRRFESYRAAIADCLADEGIELRDDASRTEVEQVAMASDAGVACIEQSGYWNQRTTLAGSTFDVNVTNA